MIPTLQVEKLRFRAVLALVKQEALALGVKLKGNTFFRY